MADNIGGSIGGGIGGGIGDDIAPDGSPIPDVPQTALAFRTWRLSPEGRLLSINALEAALSSRSAASGGSTGISQIRKVSMAGRSEARSWPSAECAES